jgi:hypothetical protein
MSRFESYVQSRGREPSKRTDRITAGSGMQQIEIREMREKDIFKCADIADLKDPQALLRTFVDGRPDDIAFVATNLGNVVGWCYSYEGGEPGVYVLSYLMGKGIEDKLYGRVNAEIKKQKA